MTLKTLLRRNKPYVVSTCYLKTEWPNKTATVTFNVNFICVRISLQKWSQFERSQAWTKSENEKNIEHGSKFGADQSI